MALVVEPDLYAPSIGDDGRYVDKVPTINNFKNGLRCPCGTRRDKVYDTNSNFNKHIKCNAHKQWLVDLNTNSHNFYAETHALKQVVHEQKLMIANQQKDIMGKNATIDFLTQQIGQLLILSQNPVTDLLEFD